MELFNFYLTISTVVSFYGCISGLSCFTCDDCEKDIEDRAICKGKAVYCISFVNGKIVKRCGTHEECKMAMNPSPDHSQFMESRKNFVDGLIEFEIATITTFNQNDSYCCDSDLCDSQSQSMLKEVSTGVNKTLEDIHETIGDVPEVMDTNKNSKGTTGGEVTNTGNSLEESFEYGITAHPYKRRHTGYNAPKLRPTTLSTNIPPESISGEKRSIKRSPSDEIEATNDQNSDQEKEEKMVSVSSDETTLPASVITITPASSTVVLDSSTVTEASENGNDEPVNKGIRLNNFGEYILIPFTMLYIFW